MAGRHPALPPPRLSARSRESAFSWCRAGWCAAARQFARKGCSHPFARYFTPRSFPPSPAGKLAGFLVCGHNADTKSGVFLISCNLALKLLISLGLNGAGCRRRTRDLLITNHPASAIFQGFSNPQCGKPAISDARSLILGLGKSRQARPTWLYATELLLKAVETGKRADLIDASHQLARAAHADGILARS